MYKSRNSFGAVFTYYFGAYPGYPVFNGTKLEPFYRRYINLNFEGLFIQGKFGAGYFHSGLYDIKQNKIFGYNVGAGIAGGYKFKLGTHLTLESILGIHYYTMPILGLSVTSADRAYISSKWYSTIGIPLDAQLKIGWQY